MADPDPFPSSYPFFAPGVRNRNSKERRRVLLRCELNLRLKRESLEAVKASLGIVVELNDALVYE
jgi:hypothetical protein